MVMALTLSNVQLQELFQRWRQGIQPWNDFVDTRKFTKPKSLAPVGRRVIRNLDRFKSNYVFVMMCVLAFAVFTSPVLLMAMAFGIAASYFVLLRSHEHKVIIAGREITLNQQLYAIGISLLSLLWIFGIGSVVFWIIGVTSVLTTVHASFYSCEDEYRTAELQPMVVV